ncbi:MAG TPA: hypothetical protein EYP10_07580 [Armatimonadetes bacterium]|nr:hypothetical protein [Armatimonadota bacterium]
MSDTNRFTHEQLEAEIDALIEEILEGQPRAAQWREWREALEERLQHLIDMRERGIIEHDDLDEYIRDLEEKVQALREQEIITEFVEQQIRAIIGKVRLEQALGEELEML